MRRQRARTTPDSAERISSSALRTEPAAAAAASAATPRREAAWLCSPAPTLSGCSLRRGPEVVGVGQVERRAAQEDDG